MAGRQHLVAMRLTLRSHVLRGPVSWFSFAYVASCAVEAFGVAIVWASAGHFQGP